jgi:transcription antitermination factor NusG
MNMNSQRFAEGERVRISEYCFAGKVGTVLAYESDSIVRVSVFGDEVLFSEFELREDVDPR